MTDRSVAGRRFLRFRDGQDRRSSRWGLLDGQCSLLVNDLLGFLRAGLGCTGGRLLASLRRLLCSHRRFGCWLRSLRRLLHAEILIIVRCRATAEEREKAALLLRSLLRASLRAGRRIRRRSLLVTRRGGALAPGTGVSSPARQASSRSLAYTFRLLVRDVSTNSSTGGLLPASLPGNAKCSSRRTCHFLTSTRPSPASAVPIASRGWFV